MKTYEINSFREIDVDVVDYDQSGDLYRNGYPLSFFEIDYYWLYSNGKWVLCHKDMFTLQQMENLHLYPAPYSKDVIMWKLKHMSKTCIHD